MPILHTTDYGYTRTATTADIRAMLGLPPRGHLPPGGTEVKKIQGYSVLVLSNFEARSKVGHSNKPHRIYVNCKGCHKEIPAGRLAQHERACKAFLSRPESLEANMIVSVSSFERKGAAYIETKDGRKFYLMAVDNNGWYPRVYSFITDYPKAKEIS